nr:DUF29 domain-containing protein [Methylosinus sp. RM1]
MPHSPLYETDFYAWAKEQAALLRAGRLSAADLENIAEEIDSMGRSEKRELVSRLSVLLARLLKWRFQPALRGNSWRLSIREQRLRIRRHLEDNPSLKALLDVAMAEGYELAAIVAQRETGLGDDAFPPTCPWPFDRAIAADFWPDADRA